MTFRSYSGRRLLASVIGACFAVCAYTAPARAQSATGSIEGTIVDQTGALMPGVTVTATQSATRASRTVVTDENGIFRIPLLPVGVYDLTAELAGFSVPEAAGDHADDRADGHAERADGGHGRRRNRQRPGRHADHRDEPHAGQLDGRRKRPCRTCRSTAATSSISRC